jgi:hypothetical protein
MQLTWPGLMRHGDLSYAAKLTWWDSEKGPSPCQLRAVQRTAVDEGRERVNDEAASGEDSGDARTVARAGGVVSYDAARLACAYAKR